MRAAKDDGFMVRARTAIGFPMSTRTIAGTFDAPRSRDEVEVLDSLDDVDALGPKLRSQGFQDPQGLQDLPVGGVTVM
jgi:hypothetical protein